MSWLEKLLPAKIAPTDPSERRQMPEGLWIKCPSCETVLYKTDLEHNQNVCPSCGHHHRIGARPRLDAFLDAEGRYEVGQEGKVLDALVEMVNRRDLAFDWFDAAVLSHQLGQHLAKELKVYLPKKAA